jgi:spore germination protein GerM
VGVAEQIFLVSPDGHLVAATREVAVPASPTQVVGALLAGPTATETAAGIQSFLTQAGVQVTTQAGGVATVNFGTNPIQVVGPDQTLAIAQVVYTVTQQPGIAGVTFEIDGKAIEVPTAAGAQVPGPVGRIDYLPQAPLP